MQDMSVPVSDELCAVFRGEGGAEGRAAGVAGCSDGGAVAAVQQQLRRRLAGARCAVRDRARVPGRGLAVLRAGPQPNPHLRALQVHSFSLLSFVYALHWPQLA